MASYDIANVKEGITDLSTNGSPSSAIDLDNFFLDSFGKIIKRSGTTVLGGSAQYPGGNAAINGIFSIPIGSLNTEITSDIFNDTTFYLSTVGKLYVLEGFNSDVWSEVLGVGGYSYNQIRSGSVRIERYRDLALIVCSNAPPIVLYKSDSDVWTMIASSLPRVNFTQAVKNATTFSGTSSGPFSWQFIYSHEFTTSNGITYRLTSAPNSLGLTSGSTGSSDLIQNLTHFPYVTEDPLQPRHYPPRPVLNIYRTDSSGAVHLLRGAVVASTDWGDTLFTANQSAPITIGGLPVYTPTISYLDAGETEDNELQDVGASCTITSNGVAWAVCRDNNTILRQAKPSSLFSWPQEFEVGFKDAIRSVHHVGIYPVVFTTGGIYRVEGFLDANGLGYVNIKTISETVRVMTDTSVVRKDKLLYFAASDGFYLTDGYTAKKTSSHLNERYASEFKSDYDFVKSKDVKGSYDEQTNRIYWLRREYSSTYNGSIWVQDLNHNAPYGVFYTLSFGGMDITSLDSSFGKLRLGDNSGYISTMIAYTSKGNSSYSTYDINPKTNDIDNSTPISERAETITYKYLSSPMSLGSDSIRKWTTRIFLTFERLTANLTTSLFTINDKDSTTRAKIPNIYSRSGVVGGLKTYKRNFPARHLRSTYKQIELTTPDVILYSSDNFGLCDRIAGSYVLQSGTWPIDILRQSIFIDGIAKGTIRLVSSSGGDTISTGTGGAPASDLTWVIRGAPRDERLKLENYVIEYTPLGEGYKDVKDDG